MTTIAGETLLLAALQWIIDFGEKVFISIRFKGSFIFVKAPSTIELRGYQIPYSGNNNGNIMGYHYQQSHSVGGTTASSNLFPPPNVDFHTGQHRQFLLPSKELPSASQLRNLCLLSAAGSASNPNLPSDNHRSFSPGMGHFYRVSSGTRSDRGGELCCTLGMQGR